MKSERITHFNEKIIEERARNKNREYAKEFTEPMNISVERYTDPEFYRLENEKIWKKSWLIAGHLDELPDAGSFKQWTLAGYPVLLVRGKDLKVRAFFNSCPHRGGPLVHDACGKAARLTCKFHAWTFDLEGELLNVPQQNNFACLDKKEKGLIPLQCELWGNLIFINSDMEAPPLMDFLGEAASELAHFNFDTRKAGITTSYELNCNWKIALEAFLEAYHIDPTHPKTVAPFLDSKGCTIELWKPLHSMMAIPISDQDGFNYLVGESDDPRHELSRTASINVSIFPNIHAPLAEFSFPLMIFWPTSINTCKIDVLFMEAEGHTDMDPEQEAIVKKQVDDVLREDFSNVEAQQQSYENKTIDHITIGYSERRIYRFHEVLDEILGKENITSHMHIAPMQSA